MSIRKRTGLLLSKVDKTDDCWRWTGAVTSGGYGSFWMGETTMGAHVASWILHGNEVPDGLELDHTCNNKLCVKPDHLEPVTHQENSRRTWERRPRTHCVNGHSFDEVGFYRKSNGSRRCKRCANDATVEWRKRKRATT